MLVCRSLLHNTLYRPPADFEIGDEAVVVEGQRHSDNHPVRMLIRPLAGSFDQQALQDALGELGRFDTDLVARFLDAGTIEDQAVFCAYEPLVGVSLAKAVGARREGLELGRAIPILHDALLGLVAMQRHGLHHGNLSLDTILISPDKRFLLDLPVPGFLDVIAPPGDCLPLSQLSLLAPERLAAEPRNDVSGDCFALGSCLFTLLTGGRLVLGDDRQEMVKQLRGEAFHEAEIQLGNQPEGVIEVLCCALHPDREHRYRNPNDLRHDLNMVLARETPDRALRLLASGEEVGAHDRNPAARSAPLEASDIQRHLEERRRHADSGDRPPSKRGRPISAKLKRLVRVADDRMSAYIKLAPGVSVPVDLLSWILESEGITIGVSEGGLLRASTPRRELRRVILAEGDPARPGRPGTDVFGEVIRPPADPIAIEIGDEGMIAIAHLVPGEAADEALLRRKLAAAGVRRGIDEEALARLVAEGDPDGSVVIARGLEPEPGDPAGFRLLQGSLEAEAEVVVVRSGERFAEWGPPRGGREGFTVLGRALAFEMPEGIPQELMAGPGTRIESRKGTTWLVADRQGAVQRTDGGILRVVPVIRVPGGLQSGRDPDPLDTDALVVIDGDVGEGSVLITSGDCIVNGDIHDAEVLVGGRLTVRGAILPGESKVSAGGDLTTRCIHGRPVVGGAITVAEDIRDAAVVATGALRASKAVGGQLTSAESFIIADIGDEDGTETLIWAGYHMPKAVKRDLAQMEERRSSSDRDLMIAEREVFRRIIEQINHKNYMQHVLGYMRRDYKRDMYRRYDQVRSRLERLRESMHHNQDELAGNRQEIHELDHEVIDQDAEVLVQGTLHPGVAIKLAETHTRRIERTQERARFQL